MSALGTVLGTGFRAFFVSAALFAVVAMAVWVLWLGSAGFDLPPNWHAHEMIFGYATAAIGGFFLTAVPGWTGTSAPGRRAVAAALAIWLAGRAMFALGEIPGGIPVAIVDLLFLPFLAATMAVRLAHRPKPQNVMFLGLLAIIWGGNVAFHLGAQAEGLRTGLLGLCALIAVLGGRVTPAFTRNAMNRAGATGALPVSHRYFELPGIVLAILLPLLVLAQAPAPAVGAVAVAAGLFQILRLAGWRLLAVIGQPILWSLHLAFAWLGLGQVLFGLAQFGLVPEAAALHVLGIGAVGGMTVAVMSRAILGHSGLPLAASRRMVAVYLLVAMAAALRALADGAPAMLWQPAVILSALLWIVAFSLFLIDVWPVVAQGKAAPPD